MGKWSDRLKTLNDPMALPPEPAEGACGGNAGLLPGATWTSGSPGYSSETVEQMSLSQFAMSGQYREVYSKMFDEIIVLAADNAELPDLGKTVVYRAAETRLLVGMPAEKIRAFHEVKVFFDGIIERGTPNESQIDAKDLLGTEEVHE